jgi:hypothetical protein
MDIDEETAEEYRPKKHKYISDDLILPVPEIPRRGFHEMFEEDIFEALKANQ